MAITCDICPVSSSTCNNGQCWKESLVYGTMLHNVNGIVEWDEAKVMCIDKDNNNVVLFIPATNDCKAQYNFIPLKEVLVYLNENKIVIVNHEMPKCPECGRDMAKADFDIYVCDYCDEILVVPVKCPMCGSDNCANNAFIDPEAFMCFSCEHEFSIEQDF